jgi:hypothetical protein
MKILFLDIHGVVNSATSIRRNRRLIDPHLAFIVRRIAIAIPDLKVVLSSLWRCLGDGREIVEKKIIRCFDVTPILHDRDLSRGHEIQAWLDEHPEVERYAILDDDNDMLEHQMVNFFQTSRRTGITPELADRIVAHFTR